MFEHDTPNDRNDRQEDVFVPGDSVEAYTGDGVLAEDAEGGAGDLPDIFPFDDFPEPPPETVTDPVDAEDFKRFHETVRASVFASVDAQTGPDPRGVETRQWTAREENIPSEARQLMAGIPVDKDANLITYSVKCDVAGPNPTADRMVEVQYQRAEEGDGTLRRVTIGYAVERNSPSVVATGEVPEFSGIRYGLSSKWRQQPGGMFTNMAGEEGEFKTTRDPSLRSTSKFGKAEMQDVLDNVQAGLNELQTDPTKDK